MKFDARAFANTATAIASGELQGRLEAEQERRQRSLADYQNALTQFQLGHQLEQEERGRQLDVTRTGLQHVGEIQPGARGGALTALLGQLGQTESQPFAYGLPQLGALQQNYPWSSPHHPQYPIPTAALAPPQAAAPAALPPPGGVQMPQGQPPPQGQPTPPQFPVPTGAAAPFGTVNEQAAAAAANVYPLPGAGVTAPGRDLGEYLNSQFGDVMGSLPQPIQPGGNPLEAIAGPRLPLVQARQQGVTRYAAAQAGASGSNPQATQPPNTRGSVPDQTPGSFAGSGTPGVATQGAPPPPVPPSASIGTAPLTVPAAAAPGNVVRFPGIDQDFPYGEVDQRAQTAAITRRQTAVGRLTNVHLTPEARGQLEDLLAQSPQPDSVAGLQGYDRVTAAVEALGAGQGAGIYSAEQRAANSTPDEDRLLRSAMAILGKSGRANDPAYVRQLIQTIGGGRIAYLADSLAEGHLGAGPIRQMLQKSIAQIYSPQFAQLDKEAQAGLLESARGQAEALGEKITLPPEVVLRMTPAQKDAAARGWAQIGVSEDRAATARAQYELSAARLDAQLKGLIGRGAGGAAGRRLTANVELQSVRNQYQDAQKKLAAFLRDPRKGYARDQYYAARESDRNRGRDPAAVMRELVNSPDQDIRHIATLDLGVLHAQHQYEDTLTRLENETQATEAGQNRPGGGGTAAYSLQGTATPGRAATPAGVPGPGQGNPTPMIFTNPRGEKRRVVKDPTQVIQYLRQRHPEWTLAQTQRQVQLMVQEAKRGRSR